MIILTDHDFKTAMSKIKADETLKDKTYERVMTKKNRFFVPKRALVLSCLCLLAVGLIGYLPHRSQSSVIDRQEYSYITIDLNPSIEFVLNKDDLVIASKAYNQDGESVLSELAYQDEPYSEVLQRLLDSPCYQTYLEKNSDIQVSVYAKDTQKCGALERLTDDLMSPILKTHHYESICIDEKTHHQAENCHTSGGKYALIQDILCLDESYELTDLQKKSIAELRSLYQSLYHQPYDNASSHHQHGSHH